MNDEQQDGLNGGEFAFVWTCLTIALIGFLALVGWVYEHLPWRQWLGLA